MRRSRAERARRNKFVALTGACNLRKDARHFNCLVEMPADPRPFAGKGECGGREMLIGSAVHTKSTFIVERTHMNPAREPAPG